MSPAQPQREPGDGPVRRAPRAAATPPASAVDRSAATAPPSGSVDGGGSPGPAGHASGSDDERADVLRRYAAEAIGTFVLVFGGVGTAVLAGDRVGFLGVAFAFGLTLLAMAYAIGPISGCHINPAVTVGLLALRKISVRDAAGYVLAQIVGGIAAAALLLAIAKGRPGGYDASAKGFGTNGWGAHSPDGYHLGAVITVEVVLTALLVFTVLACTDRIAQTGFAGIPIGLTLTLIHLISIPVDNTSVNPARSIGPALFAGTHALSQLWVFLIAPIAGALLAAGIYRTVFAGSRRIDAETSAVAAVTHPTP